MAFPTDTYTATDLAEFIPEKKFGNIKCGLIDLDAEMQTRAKRNPQKIKMNKLTASYVAGFIDGEGYLGLARHKKKYLRLTLKIASTNKEIIEWFKNSFGGYLGTKKHKDGENHKDAFYWEIYDRTCYRFLLAIYPYLRIKKKNAELLISFYKEREKQKGKKITKESAFYREKIKKEIKELNYRGLLHAERLNDHTPTMAMR